MKLSIDRLKNIMLKTEKNKSSTIAEEPLEELSKGVLKDVGGGWWRTIFWKRIGGWGRVF